MKPSKTFIISLKGGGPTFHVYDEKVANFMIQKLKSEFSLTFDSDIEINCHTFEGSDLESQVSCKCLT